MQLNSLLHEISVSEIQEIEINLRLKEWFIDEYLFFK